jgi:DNA-binding transcriptional LysR family regulator
LCLAVPSGKAALAFDNTFRMLYPSRLYVYVDAVARAGSIRKAAEKLHVASTALNRKILEAEDNLGTPLFERLPRGVRLTAAGEILVSHIRRSFNDFDYAISQVEQLRGLMRGVVRLACAESVATDIIPHITAMYQVKHPGVQFQLTVGGTQNLLQALLDDQVELLVAHDPPAHAQVTVHGAIAQPLHAIMHADHPLAKQASLRLADCQPWPVVLGDDSFGSRRLIDQHLAKSRIQLRVVVESDSVETCKAFARHAQAICFQFEAGTRRDVALGELVAIPLTDTDLAGSRLVLASRSGRALPMASSSFLESLRGALFDKQ